MASVEQGANFASAPDIQPERLSLLKRISGSTFIECLRAILAPPSTSIYSRSSEEIDSKAPPSSLEQANIAKRVY